MITRPVAVLTTMRWRPLSKRSSLTLERPHGIMRDQRPWGPVEYLLARGHRGPTRRSHPLPVRATELRDLPRARGEMAAERPGNTPRRPSLSQHPVS